MILLPVSHRVIVDTLKDICFPTLNPTRLDERVADFDGVSYHISTPYSKSIVLISLFCPCFSELINYGAMDILKSEYGPYLLPQPESGYHVSLEINLEQVSSLPIQEQESLIQKLGLLKRNILAAPFYVAFDAQMKGQQTHTMAIHYREEEAFYVKAMEDRVTVIFSTTFKEETDRVFGKVFLQEFVDARRLPAIQNAPQVLYSPKELPMELRELNERHNSSDIGYVTFVLFPRHFTTSAAREESISKIQLFRDYLHYHIKCSKSFMHSRMRARVDSFLKVLNRAKPEKPEDQREKKTATGKTFKRF